jgi:hypothetical protein
VERLCVQHTATWALAERLRPYIASACRAAVATPHPVNRYAASALAET